MCRLTLIVPKADTPDMKLAVAMLTHMMFVNSDDIGNTDGAGVAFISPETSFQVRSADKARSYLTSDHWKATLNEWKDHIYSGRTVLLGHVRAASKGIPVEVDYSHPFLIDNKIVGAHNGTIKNQEDFHKGSESDSYSFFRYLVDQMGDSSLSYDLLKTATCKIEGAYCMLVSDLTDSPQNVWVPVGKTRELWTTENDHFLIINTTPKGIRVLSEIKSILELMDDTRAEMVDFPEPTKLKEETIFRVVGNELTEVGPTKENTYVAQTRVVNHFLPSGVGNSGLTGTKSGTTTKPSTEDLRTLAQLMIQAEDSVQLSVDERSMFMQEFGLPVKFLHDWMELDEYSLYDFIQFVSFLETSGALEDIGYKNKLWKRITRRFYKMGKMRGIEHYELAEKLSNGFQFPYWLNSTDTLEQLMEEVENNDTVQ